MQASDHEIWLWNEIRYNNERALRQLYMGCYDNLFRYGLHAVNDSTRVMDCINEVFTEIWTRRHRLPEVERVQGYLFIIFKRKLSRLVGRKYLVHSLPGDGLTSLAQHDSSYEDLLIAFQTEEEMKNLVRKALDRLTPRQKEIIELRYYEELSLEEISERLQVSLRTIYNTLHAAISTLRKELNQ